MLACSVTDELGKGMKGISHEPDTIEHLKESLREVTLLDVPFSILVRSRYIIKWHGARAILRKQNARFIFQSHEIDNFTYELSNVKELIMWISRLLDVPANEIENYVNELSNDVKLTTSINQSLKSRRDRNPHAMYARRFGWYAIVRSRKPEVVFETGTHDGLGTSVLARAVERNREEGWAGHVWTFDSRYDTGWLIPPFLSSSYSRIIGNSLRTIPAVLQHIGKPVGFFLHDSLHTYDHEMRELQTVWPFLAPRGTVLSDNSHSMATLRDFSRSVGGRYSIWRENPRNHPYPGGGIGILIPAPPMTKE